MIPWVDESTISKGLSRKVSKLIVVVEPQITWSRVDERRKCCTGMREFGPMSIGLHIFLVSLCQCRIEVRERK